MTRRILRRLALIALMALASTPTLAAPQAISAHGGWGAFRDDGRCYAIAMAEATAHRQERQPFASVDVSGAGPIVYFRLSRTISRDAIVTLDVGNRRFRLSAGGDSAWGTSGAGGNAAIANAIRSRDTMTVGARDTRGRFFRDSYKLAGAPTAMDAAMIACR